MACSLGIEQDCSECRMCGKGKIGNKITNYEKIKGMSVEEIAKSIENMGCVKCENIIGKCNADDDKSCEESIIEWLESECDVEC